MEKQEEVPQDSDYNSIFEDSKDNVKVCIRIRPLNDREKNSQIGKNRCIQLLDDSTVQVDRVTDMKNFNFDFVGAENIKQETIFNSIAKPIADSCMQGYNGTIFAYGQTGAGKTFTIQGPEIDINQEAGAAASEQQTKIKTFKRTIESNNHGIIQRSFDYIFKNIQAQKDLVAENNDGGELTFLIKCSYLEIYNEQIMDLLEPSSINLNVREDIKKGVYVEGLREEVISSYRDMMALILRGAKNRHVGETSMNRESSRSHSVLTTFIESKSMSSSGVWNMKSSRFHIIDLAGSERSKNTNAVGERLKEAGMINKSLSALGNVINSLVDLGDGKMRHVPYRDSKLTFILRDSLGGNSKTVIIANISPSALNMSETLSTLEFAKRAKQIKNKAVVNEDSSGTILILKNEIKRLKKELDSQKLIKQPEPLIENGLCKQCRMNSLLDEVDLDNSLEEENLLNDSIGEGEDFNLLEKSLEFKRGIKDIEQSPQLNSARRGQGVQIYKMKLKRMAMRVQQAEALLEKNLEMLSQQKRQYEEELQGTKDKLQQHITAYDSLVQQVNRDKMKMKFREDKIAKLEQEHTIDYDQEMQNLRDEIRLMNEQIDQERDEVHNPKIAQLKAQIKDLENITPVEVISLGQCSLIDQLNKYIKDYGLKAQQAQQENLRQISQDLISSQTENSNVKGELNDLQGQYEILLKQNVQGQEVIQKVRSELVNSNLELQRLQQETSSVKEEYELVQNELENQKLDNADLEDKIKQMHSETKQNSDSVQDQLAKLRENQKQLDDEKQKLIVQNERLSQELTINREELQDRIKESENYQSQVNEIKHDIELKSCLIEELCKKGEAKDGQIDELRKNHQEALKTTQDKDKRIDELRQIHQELNQKVQDKDTQIEQLSKNCQEITDKALIKDDEILKLEKNCQEMSQKSQENHNKFQEIVQKILLKDDEIEQLNQNHQQKSSQLEEIAQQMKVKEEMIEELKQSQESFKDEQKERLQQKDLQLQIVSQEQIQQLNKKEEEIKILSKQHEEMLVQKDQQVQKFLQEHEEKVSQVFHEHNQRIQQKDKQLQQFQQEMSNILSQKESQLSEYEQQVMDKDNQILQIQNDQENQLQGLQQQLINKSDQIEQLQNNLENQLQEHQASLNEKSSAVQSSSQIIQNLEQQMTESQGKIKNYEDLIGKLQQKMTNIEHQNNELNLQIKQAHDQNQSYLDESVDVINKEHQEQISNLQQNLMKQQSESIRNLQEQYDMKVNNLNITINALKAELQEQLLSKQVEIDSLQGQLDKQQLEIQSHYQQSKSLNEQVEASKELLHQKNMETQGAEKDQAESQVLLIEAQNLIQDRESEINRIISVAKGHEDKIKQLQDEVDQLERSQAFYQGENEAMANEIKKLQEESSELVHKANAKEQQSLEESQIKEQLQYLLKQNEQEKQSLYEQIQKLEQEKDTLTFKRDENVKNLEQKLKESKKQSNAESDLQRQVDQLSKQIEQEVTQKNLLKEGYMRTNQECTEQMKQSEEIINQLTQQNSSLEQKVLKYQKETQEAAHLSEEIDRHYKNLENQKDDKIGQMQTKQQSMLAEITQMQQCIDLQNQEVEQLKTALQEIKDDCYRRIHLLQQIMTKTSSGLEEEERQKNKDAISEALKKVADVEFEGQSSGDNSMEIALLISQTIFEMSKLYEKQIMLEKKKASLDFKKFSDKYDKQKLDMKQLQSKNENLKFENQKQNVANSDRVDHEVLQLRNEKQEFLISLEKTQKKLEHAHGLTTELQQQLISQKKQAQEQKQLYEVRVASQEQEIEQHQFRYKELENQSQLDLDEQEQKFLQVQQQVQTLSQTIKNTQMERSGFNQQMQDMQSILEMVQSNDEDQKQNIEGLKKDNSRLQKQLHERSNEMEEVINSLRLFSAKNKEYQLEIKRLENENEMLQVGHRNPNQKIQLTMKIKEENNKLRDDVTRLQEDLQRKLQIIQRMQTQLDSNSERPDKPKDKYQKELNQILEHLVTLPQFQRVADHQNLNTDIIIKHTAVGQSGSGKNNGIQMAVELLSLVDDSMEALTFKTVDSDTRRPPPAKPLPPRPGKSSETQRNLQSNKSQSNIQAPVLSKNSYLSAKKTISSISPMNMDKNMSLSKKMSQELNNHFSSSKKMVERTSSGQVQNRVQSSTSQSSRYMVQQQLQSQKNDQAINPISNQLNQGPDSFKLNSYSSIYSKQLSQKENSRSSSISKQLPDPNEIYRSNTEKQLEYSDAPSTSYQMNQVKHKQYKQAQSQKSQFGQRSKSRQALGGTFTNN